MSAELVFIPSPVSGHVASTIEIAKSLIDRDDRISITILSLKFPFTSFDDSYVKSLVASQPRIKLVKLPQVGDLLPPKELFNKSPEYYIYVAVENCIPLIRDALKDVLAAAATRVAGVFLDLFCMPMLDVAAELGLPSYLFFLTNPGFLSFLLHLPIRHEKIGSEFEFIEPDLVLPGFNNPVPTRVLPSSMFNKEGGYRAFLELARRFRKTKGILVNSFAELEPRDVVRALRSDGATPPIYMVGPVVDHRSQPHASLDRARRDEIIRWLDEQPEASVLLLCFGSIGRFFGASQLREIARALERTGYRFLWCVMSKVHGGELNGGDGPGDVAALLPAGFIERTAGRGMVCDWGPQVEVLAHRATGGFVSHCGWNSTLESLWHGVPIVAWPIYAEQQLNAFRLVREFGLAVEVRIDYREGAEEVTADEIEAAMRRLMEDGGEIRRKAKEVSAMARKAVAEGGSSCNAIGQLVKDIMGSD